MLIYFILKVRNINEIVLKRFLNLSKQLSSLVCEKMSIRKRSMSSPTNDSAKKNLKVEENNEVLAEVNDAKSVINLSDLAAFFTLIEKDDHIYDFLTYDEHCMLADKYLLAMVFTYFIRAKLKRREFNRTNFFIALYLANDIEEDDEEHKFEILYWALGSNWQQYTLRFLKLRDYLWKQMNYRGIVSCRLCNEVMSLAPEHDLWKRHRSAYHAGAMRPHSKLLMQEHIQLDSFDSPPVCRLCLTSDAGDDDQDSFKNNLMCIVHEE